MEGSPDPRTDGELLTATAADPEAFGVFYRRHVRGVLSFFRRRVPSAELAFDLTAETFAAALEATPRYEPRPEPARGWLYGIAHNKLREAQRHGRADDAARRELGMAPITLLERELVQAAARRSAAAEPMSPAPGVMPWPRARRRRIRVGDVLSAAAAAGAAVLALAALALLGGGGGGHPASTAAATPREKLLASLAVLRRPQTPADLALPELSQAHTPHAGFQPLLGTPDRALVRRATTAPWGAKVFLVPFRPLGASRFPQGWTAYAPLHTRLARGESITVFGGPGGRGESLTGLTAQDIIQGKAIIDEAGTGRARRAIRFLVVVPDGVGKVSVVFARGPIQRPNRTEEQLLFDERTPHGNVVAFQETGAKPAKPWLMTWETRSGRVLRHFPLPASLG